MNFLRNYKYKNLTLFVINIILAIILSKTKLLDSALLNLGHIKFIGTFLAGMLFTSTFTIGISILMLVDLAKTLSPLEISLIGGLGAVVGDLAIFRFENKLFHELMPLYNSLGGKHITKFLNHKYINWILPIIGAVIIASPFPDELGISLLGGKKMKNYNFVILSFILNNIGIFILVTAILGLTVN